MTPFLYQNKVLRLVWNGINYARLQDHKGNNIVVTQSRLLAMMPIENLNEKLPLSDFETTNLTSEIAQVAKDFQNKN